MASVATLASPTRALARPRRVDTRGLLAIFLGLLAAGGSFVFWTASSDVRTVLVATRELPAGATLTSSDLAIARVRIDDAIYQAAVPATELRTIVGRQLAEPLHAQQLVVPAQLSPRPVLPPGQMAYSIPVTPETAAGGLLQPGNAVKVLVILNKGKPDARSVVVLPSVTVYDIGHARPNTAVNTALSDPGRTPSAGPIQWLTLSLTEKEALQLSQAEAAGELRVALLPPERQNDDGHGAQPD